MKEKKTISSWSGGKDSCLACYRVMNSGYKVSHLLNLVSRETKRGCFHGIDANLMKLQARLIDIPLVQHEVSSDMKNYEEEFKRAIFGFRLQGAQAMVFGDIYLNEHKEWVERVCNDSGIMPLEPLWNAPAIELVREFVESGFKAVIISCKADVMGQDYIGRTIDMELACELIEKGICPAGENGEYHTLVIDGPIFNKPIRILEFAPVFKKGFWDHWSMEIKSYSS